MRVLSSSSNAVGAETAAALLNIDVTGGCAVPVLRGGGAARAGATRAGAARAVGGAGPRPGAGRAARAAACAAPCPVTFPALPEVASLGAPWGELFDAARTGEGVGVT